MKEEFNLFVDPFVYQGTIRGEVWAVDRDYAFGIVILVVLLFISPVIIFLIRDITLVLNE